MWPFTPQLPLDEHAARWVEGALAALECEFGYDLFRRPPFEPTAEFFPGSLDGTSLAVERVVHRVAALMDIPRDRYRVVVEKLDSALYLEDESGHWVPTGYAGLFEETGHETIIRINTHSEDTLANIIGTSAHEFSHLKLMGEGRIDGERFDNELLTDLTAVFHGFGIFLANSPRACLAQMSYWPGTKVKRPEYMSLPMLGHALAHQVWHQGQTKPAWLPFLNMEARACMKASLRWLRASQESNFRPPVG